MVAELTALRDQIDDVDKALLNLLAKRLELVAKVGEVKSRFGLPIYVPEREASMLASRRAEAEAIGVPPDLIEDVLRRVMRESYSSENDKGSKRFVLLCVRSSLWAAADRWGVCLKNAHAVGLSGPYSGTAGLAARQGHCRRCRNGDRQRADSCY